MSGICTGNPIRLMDETSVYIFRQNITGNPIRLMDETSVYTFRQNISNTIQLEKEGKHAHKRNCITHGFYFLQFKKYVLHNLVKTLSK